METNATRVDKHAIAQMMKVARSKNGINNTGDETVPHENEVGKSSRSSSSRSSLKIQSGRNKILKDMVR